MPELRRLIVSNGFSPKEALVVVAGVLENGSRTPMLKADTTNEMFVLTPGQNATAFDELKQLRLET